MYFECLPCLGTLLGSGDAGVNNTGQNPCPLGANNIPLEEGRVEDKKQNNFYKLKYIQSDSKSCQEENKAVKGGREQTLGMEQM